MAIEFECPVCAATIRVKDEAAGKKGRCPNCKTLLLVPDPGPEEPAAAATVRDVPAAVPPPAVAPPAPSVEAAATPPAPAPPPAGAGLPFEIVPELPPAVRPVARRQRSGVPTAKVVSAVAGVLCIGIVLLVGWLLYRSSGPELEGSIAGDRLQTVSLDSASFEVPSDLPKEVAERVMARLAKDELALKSEYVAVTLKADGGRVGVAVAPGPQAAAVRVPLGKNAAVKAAIAKKRKAVAEVKRKELEAAAAELLADYDAYLHEKKPLTRLPGHRDAVALNATTSVVGYSVEAVIAEHPFRCAAEDADGNCYFFLPVKTKTFRLRGRELPDGTRPLPVDFEVTVKEGPAETVTVETEESANAAEASEGPKEPPPDEEPERATDETGEEGSEASGDRMAEPAT